MKKASRLIYDLLKGLNGALFGIVLLLLGVRFILRVLGANLTPFVDWIYDTSQALLYPFRGIFEQVTVDTGTGSVLELSTVFAILIYGIIYILIESAINYAERVTADAHK